MLRRAILNIIKQLFRLSVFYRAMQTKIQQQKDTIKDMEERIENIVKERDQVRMAVIYYSHL